MYRPHHESKKNLTALTVSEVPNHNHRILLLQYGENDENSRNTKMETNMDSLQIIWIRKYL